MIEKTADVTPEDYQRLFPSPSTSFASVDFNLLNAAKAERLRFIVGINEGGKPLMGLIAGLRDGMWRSPFSAPMAALSWNRDVSLATVGSFFRLVAESLGGSTLRVVLPPSFIAPDMLAKIDGTLINMASGVTADFNYHYDLTLVDDFEANLKSNARNKYHRALKEQFIFEPSTIARAYRVILANRTAKGYYLAMKEKEVEATSAIIDIDSFVMSRGNDDVAAAIVYRIAPGVAHVVYWGDAPGYEGLRPMNILPLHVFKFYRDMGFRIVNIGTASTDGIPNHGLCDYKESLGCSTTLITTATITSPTEIK